MTVLNSLSNRYRFNNPTPAQQIYDLRINYTENTNRFIDRFWLSTIETAKKLKTEKGRQNKINVFFNSLTNDFTAYLSDQSIAYVTTFKNKSVFDNVETKKQSVKCGKYDVNTIANIQAIPNNDYEIMRPLQKSATDHKRNGDLQLAIECLKKSNAISDNISNQVGKLLEKEYLRVIKYIELTGNLELAKVEEEKIYKAHPEFWDKRISNRQHINDAIRTSQKHNTDLIQIFSNRSCSICSKYDKQVFSISGKSLKFCKLPDEVRNQTHSCKKCIITAHPYHDL